MDLSRFKKMDRCDIQSRAFSSMASAYPILLECLPQRLLSGKSTTCWIDKVMVKFFTEGEDPFILCYNVENSIHSYESDEFYPTQSGLNNIENLRDFYLKPLLDDLEDYLGESEAVQV